MNASRKLLRVSSSRSSSRFSAVSFIAFFSRFTTGGCFLIQLPSFLQGLKEIYKADFQACPHQKHYVDQSHCCGLNNGALGAGRRNPVESQKTSHLVVSLIIDVSSSNSGSPLSAFFRSFWVLFNSSFILSNSETVFCSLLLTENNSFCSLPSHQTSSKSPSSSHIPPSVRHSR